MAPHLPNENQSLPPLCFWNVLFILLLYQLAHSASRNIFSWIYAFFFSLNCKFLNERGFLVLTFYHKMCHAKHTHLVVAYNKHIFIWIIKVLWLLFNRQKNKNCTLIWTINEKEGTESLGQLKWSINSLKSRCANFLYLIMMIPNYAKAVAMSFPRMTLNFVLLTHTHNLFWTCNSLSR